MSRAVGSDQGLATLYTTLILVTPGAQLSQATKVITPSFNTFLFTIKLTQYNMKESPLLSFDIILYAWHS